MLATLVLCGCARKPPVPYVTVFKEEEPYIPKAGSGNAYDDYLIAAKTTADLVPKEDRRRNFTSGFKVKMVSTLSPVLESVSKATRHPCDFVYRAHGPFKVDTVREDWFLIGRGFAWKTQALFDAREDAAAIDLAVCGLRFACDLTKGDVEDASVGYGVFSQIRQVVRDHQEELSPDLLVKLSQGVSDALKRCGDAAEVIDHQEQAMLAAVQTVKDSYRDKETTKLEDLLYKDSHDAVTYLRNLKDEDRPAYFAAFAEEAHTTAAYAKSIAAQTPSQRKPITFPDKQSRPWKRFSQHFFSPVFTYLDLRDKFLASARLWAVDSRCRAAALRGDAPAAIDHLGTIAVDPYSGNPFVYYAAGSDYKVYSVGKDGRDDGGHSDDGYQPDMPPDAVS